MKFKKLIAIMLSVSFLTLPIGIQNSSALDMNFYMKEQRYVYRNKWLYITCFGRTDDKCEKYIVRYDAMDLVIKHFKELIAENTNHEAIKNALIKVGTGAGIYYRPFTTVAAVAFALTSLPIACIVNNEIIESVGETAGMLTKIVIKIKNWLVGNKPINKEDRGMIGNALDVMCGDKTSENQNEGLFKGFIKLLFGETSKEVLEQNKKKKFYSKVLNDLYKKIDNKEYENNDILIISTDFADEENPKYAMKFSQLISRFEYEKPLEEYFKDIK